MTIIETIRNHIKSCPYLDKYNGAIRLGINYLSDKTTTYSIEEVPADTVVKRYIDGSKQKRFTFIFASREMYGENVKQNLENSGFYEYFTEWLENTPISMDNNREFIRARAITQGYAFNVEANKAQYQIQCEMIYKE